MLQPAPLAVVSTQLALTDRRALSQAWYSALRLAAEGAMAQLGDFIKMGNEAMKESVQLTRETTLKMVDQSKKVVEAAKAAILKGRE